MTMMNTQNSTDRIYNFSAGPSTLPESVLEQAREDILNIQGTGIGVLEHSHRGATITEVFTETLDLCRELSGVGDEHEILFLSGGGSHHAAMLAMNFLPEGRTGDYLLTGNWARVAKEYADSYGSTHVAFDGKDTVYHRIPGDEDVQLSENPAYVHYCSNNTIYGTSFSAPPKTDAPLFVDMSSEMFSRTWDYSGHAVSYACAQKNLGPAAGSCLIVRKDLLERTNHGLPKIFSYAANAEKESRLNTPPVFTIYMMGLVFKWIKEQGGVAELEVRNREKAGIIYDAIDGSDGFWMAHADHGSRSMMNIPFRTNDPEMDKRFIAEAQEHGMSTLKGHRSVGGMRASIYNAFPRSGCEALAGLMKEFAARNG